MAYTINLTDGSIFATIPDGTINTSSSMTLIGKNYAGYGEFLDENFIHLLENSSNSTAPSAPLTGQLWWDKTNSLLKVYNGSGFKTLNLGSASASAPSNNTLGDLWYDTINQQLKVWTGSAWLLVGPSFTAGTGTTGAIVDTIIDNTLTSHVVIKLYVNDSVVGIVSKDAAFTPQTSIPGYTQVKPGITLATLVGSQVPLFQGTATNSQQLNSLGSASFMRSDTSTSTTGTLSVLNDNGLAVGYDSDFKAGVTGIDVNLQNQTNGGNLIFKLNVSSTPTTILTLSAGGAVLTTSLTLGSALAATSGGTGQASYTTGDILYANSSTALAKLNDVATGNALISGGVGVAPSWGKIDLTTHVTGVLPVANGGTSGTLPATSGGTGQASYTTGDLLYASSSTALAKLNDVPSGNALISGGVGTAPSWGKVDLTTHISGTLPVANGGTGVTATGTSGNVLTSNGSAWVSQAAAYFGTGQTWQDVSGSRTSGVTYTNTTGKPIMVSAGGGYSGATGASITATVDGVTVVSQTLNYYYMTACASFVVPNGSSYVVTVTGSWSFFAELR